MDSVYESSYNQELWTQKIQIVNPLLSENNVILLNNDFVMSIVLNNKLTSFSPTLRIQYTDINFRLLNFIQIGTCYVALQMSNSTKKEAIDIHNIPQIEVGEISEVFIINDVRIINQSQNDAALELVCVHKNVEMLCRKIPYSTNKARGKISPLRIIQNIMGFIQYDMNTNYVETDVKIDFTSTVGQRASQMIKYLLHKAVSPSTPPTYLYHNIRSGQAMLYNRKLIPDGMMYPENNVYAFTSDGSNHELYRVTVSDIKTGSAIGGSNLFDQYGDYVFYNFDVNKRVWNYIQYKSKNTLNLMTDNLLAKDDSVYTTDLYYDKLDMINTGIINKRVYEFPNHNDIYMYDYLSNIELKSTMMSFRIFGDSIREVGQMINLNTENNSLYSFCGGIWTISEISHVWEDKTYVNEITCYRTTKVRQDLTDDMFLNDEGTNT